MECNDGPVLVLAGAGSGKTRVLTHRIAYLIQCLGVPAESILAVTFSNKAAKEMRSRVINLLADMPEKNGSAHGVWLGTFHAICTRMLRTHADRLGYTHQFSIYDREDQLAMMERVIKEVGKPSDDLSSGYVRYRISRAKSDFQTPDDLLESSFSGRDEFIAQIYKFYQVRLRENNAMDFDDLLLLPIELFRTYPEILKRYCNRFQYLLVDEFQDTNRAQYIWLKALAGTQRNLFAVGDDDQSIYRWRGADIRNILEIEKDFPDCQIFRLEQNYRSTKNILDAAHSVIVQNHNRMAKRLWTEREVGEKVILLEADNEHHEAQIFFDKISEEFGRNNNRRASHHRSFRDFAILYRTNAQSRVLEDMLRRNGVPYIVIGGVRFYERKEVKDILAYFKIMANPADSISLKRIINYPLRGIGEVTLKRLDDFAISQKISLFKAMGKVNEIQAIKAGLRKKVSDFHQFATKYLNLKKELSLPEWCHAIVDETGIIQLLKKEAAQDRIDNIRELLNSIREYAKVTPSATIEGFLEETSLVADIDNWDSQSNAITLMTLHSAKGLEFPVVFIAGVEEGLFPLLKDSDDGEVEEERRLFYVGATRAQEKLYISYANSRSRYDEPNKLAYPSRFINELDSAYLDLAVVRRNRYTEFHDTYDPDTIMPCYEDESQEAGMIKSGKWVMHTSFGRGRIIAVDGRGENQKVTVDFENVGAKKILVKYGNLRLI